MKKYVCMAMVIAVLVLAVAVPAFAEESSALFEIEYVQVGLGNALSMRFAFPADGYDDWSGCYAVVTKTYADGRADVVRRVGASDWQQIQIGQKSYYCITFTDISGKEMADDVYAAIYNANDEQISTQRKDSVRDYVMRIMDKQDAASRTMLVDMLNYGAAAQAYYGYGLDDLANAKLSQAQCAYGTQVLSPCRNYRQHSERYMGTRLELKNSIVMQMAFVGLTEDMTAKVELVNHSGVSINQTVKPVKADDGMLVIVVDQLAVADCRNLATVTVFDAKGNVYATATDSLESYVARMSGKGSLFEAIMKFADSAQCYLHAWDTSEELYFRLSDDGNSYVVTGATDPQATQIEIPETYCGKPVTGIGQGAFAGNTSVTEVQIPASIAQIGANAFADCTALEKIRYDGTEEQWETVQKGTNWDENTSYTMTFHIRGHLIGEWQIVTEATCDDPGERRCYYTCGCVDENGDPLLYKTEVIPALGHSVVIDPGSDASCTEDGITEGSHCDRCGAVLAEQTTIGALGHRYSDALTCYDHQCLQDGCTHVEPATTEHWWTDWTYVESGGCSSVAYLVRTCLDCHIVENMAGEQEVVAQHDWQFDIKAPTCTTDGYVKSYCKKCGIGTVTYLEAPGHLYSKLPDNADGHPEKCDRPGCDYRFTSPHHYQYGCDRTCETCGWYRDADHDWDRKTDGQAHWMECSYCHETKDREDHRGGTATCSKQAVCEVCGAPYGSPLPHTWDNDCDTECNECPATRTTEHRWEYAYVNDTHHLRTCKECKAAEYVEHSGGVATCQERRQCTRCGKAYGELGDHVSINKDDDAVVIEPTCEVGGTYYHTCDVCGHYDETDTYQKDNAPGHDESGEYQLSADGNGHYKICGREICRQEILTGDHVHNEEYDDAVVIEPTCTEGGIYCRTCDVCGYYDPADTYQKNNIPGHDAGGEFQPTEDGTQHYQVCQRPECRKKIYSDHVHEKQDDDIVVKEPTCTEGGIYCRTCDDCGYYDPADTYQKNNALGHDESGTFQPTEDGAQHYQICQRPECREWLYSDHVHEKQDNDIVVKEPTCTEGGIYYHTCDVCGYHDLSNVYQKDNPRGHEGGEATCQKKAICDRCNLPYGYYGAHKPETPKKWDDTDHWLVCKVCKQEIGGRGIHEFDNACDEACNDCGYTREVPDHVFDDACDDKCNECGYLREPSHTWATEYTSTDSDNTHWIVCVNCGAEQADSRKDCHGGQIICGEKNICEDCGYRYGAVQTHDFTVKHEIPENKVPNQQEPACGKGYLYYYACSRCGKLANNLTDTFEGSEKKACVPKPDYLPLAGDAEEHHIFCENCGKILSSAPHAFGEYELTKSPSCYQEGEEVRICSTCGYQDSRPVDERPHQLSSEIFVVTTPIPGQEGETVYRHELVYRCANYDHCGHEETTGTFFEHFHEEIDVTLGVPATCTESGTTYGVTCGVAGCGEVFLAQEIIPALGHDFVDGVCSRCGEKEAAYSKGLAYTLSTDKTYYIVTGIGDCTDTEIVIPATYEGLPVKEIGDSAFSSNDTITSVVIPEGVTTIKSYAFYYCTKLTDVTLPDTLISIYNHAFANCTSLTEVTLPTTLTSIGDSAFYWCRSLTEVTLPDTLTSIGERAFYWCTSLKEIALPDTLTSIGDSAFNSCASLTEVTLPATLTSVGDSVFSGCSSLMEVTLPDTLTSIGDCAFLYCTSLKEIALPDTLTSIGNSAFNSCTSLTEVTLPDTLTSIGDYAFAFSGLKEISIPVGVASIGRCAFHSCEKLQGIWVDSENVYYSSDESGVLFNKDMSTLIAAPCGMTDTYAVPASVTQISDYAFCDSALTEISLPDTLETIGANAFYGCSSLRTIRIPASVTSIGERAFTFCNSLDGIWVDPENACYSSDDNGVLYDKEQTLLIAVPCDKTGTLTVPSGVVTIGTHAVRDSYLREVILPEGLETIKYNAFYDAELKTITLPSSLTDIGSYAFAYCRQLDYIYYEGTTEQWNAVTKGTNWVLNCPAEIICLGDSATSEGLAYTLSEDESYYIVSGIGECTDTEIVIPATYEGLPVKEIGWGAFGENTEITKVVIPGSVTTVGDGAFYNCDALTSVMLSEGITRIGYFAFEGCDALTSIEIPEGVTSVGDSVFAECGSLTSVTIPGSLTRIGDSMFYQCSALKNVTISEGVTEIGYCVFSECTKLEEIMIPASVESIDSHVFYGCSSLRGIWADEDSQYFYSDSSGVLFNKELTTLEAAPATLKGEYAIPESVYLIAPGAFYMCTGLESITLPVELFTLESDVFRNCESLTSITLPTGLHSIDPGAFAGCTKLTEIVIPNYVVIINDAAFEGCTALEHVTISKRTTEIGYNAFYGCSALRTICFMGSTEQWNAVTKGENWDYDCNYTLTCVDDHEGSVGLEYTLSDDGTYYIVTSIDACKDTKVIIPAAYYGKPVQEIGRSAFYRASITGITIPDSVTTIGELVFYECSKLTDITLSDGLTGIGSKAFYGCVALEEITLPNSLTSIGSSAFSGCSALTSIVLPEKVSRIEFSTFAGCTSLQNVTLPEKLMSIYTGAFEDCVSLTSIRIPRYVIQIGAGAFSNCTGLKTIYYENTPAHWDAMERCYDNWDEGCSYSLICTVDAADREELSYWLSEDATYCVVKGIGTCTGSEISIPSTYGCLPVKEIAVLAFDGNTTLTKVTISNGITTIDASAFSNCENLTEVILPNSITKIDAWAFSCTGLTEIVIPEGVLTLGEYAFAHCRALESVSIPSSVASIEEGVFDTCGKSLEIQVDPDNKYYASDEYGVLFDKGFKTLFYAPNDMLEYVIPATVANISMDAFIGADLISITIPVSVTSIGDEAFAFCNYLEYIYYEGTTEQWNAITKGTDWWYSSSGSYTLICLGDPDYDGPVTDEI